MLAKWIIYWVLSAAVVIVVFWQTFSSKSRFAPPPSPDVSATKKGKTNDELATKKDQERS